MHQNRRTRDQDLPVSSEPPTKPTERPYGLVRPRRRCRRLKIESIKVSQTRKGETTYRRCAQATQPPGNLSKHLYGVVEPRHRPVRIKIEPVKVKIEHISVNQAREDGITYRIYANPAQPPRNPSKCSYGVIGLICRRGCIKIKPINVSSTRNGGKAYLGHINTI